MDRRQLWPKTKCQKTHKMTTVQRNPGEEPLDNSQNRMRLWDQAKVMGTLFFARSQSTLPRPACPPMLQGGRKLAQRQEHDNLGDLWDLGLLIARSALQQVPGRPRSPIYHPMGLASLPLLRTVFTDTKNQTKEGCLFGRPRLRRTNREPQTL